MTEPLRWKKIPAGELKPGDLTEFGAGRFRTVSRVEDAGNGIVRVYHRETWEPYHDSYAKAYMVTVVDRSPAPVKPRPWDEPHKHVPKQHRDGKEPWCNHCGLTADGRPPLERL